MSKAPGPKSNPDEIPELPDIQAAIEDRTDPNLVVPSSMRIPNATSTPAPVVRPSVASVAPIKTTHVVNRSSTPTATAVSAPPARATPRMPEMGPLDGFMKDPQVTEIMVNDLRNVMIEKEGKLIFSGFAYQSIDELNRLTRNILDITGRVLSPDSPYLDTMLPDGSRVNIVGPPLTINGPCITIRKFPTQRFAIEDLVTSQSLDPRMANFLHICVAGKINILISGGTGTGKTTLLNALTGFVPKGERLVTIEDTPELSISHFNSVRLQTKPQSPASGPVTARDLVANALRMRPDRIIVGECRRAEAFDMLQAMNTGHDGSMTTIHANSPRDALARLETLCMMAGVDLPIVAIRRQISSAIDLIIQIKRLRSGRRIIAGISELTGMEGEMITMQDIFRYDGNDDQGRFKCLGLVPTFIDRLRAQGIDVPADFFA